MPHAFVLPESFHVDRRSRARVRRSASAVAVMQRVLRWGGATGAAAVLAACRHAQSSLAPTSEGAQAITHAWELMLWIGVPIYLLMLLLVGLAVWRKRSDGHARASDRVLWFALIASSVVVAGLLAVLAVAGGKRERQSQVGEGEPIAVRITARQWWWQVDYLDADPAWRFSTANELHLPVDRPVRIELRSGDVIHALWIPALGGMRDMIPGRVEAFTVTPRKVGRYRGQCAAFCGLQHANMALDVRVDDAADFAAWQAHQRAPAAVPATRSTIAGGQVFAASCSSCHAIDGVGADRMAGPDLTHLASRHALGAGAMPLDRSALATWIADPQRHKPGTRMPAVTLQPQQLSDVTDYLMSLE